MRLQRRSLLCSRWCFRAGEELSSALKREAVSFSETSTPTYRSVTSQTVTVSLSVSVISSAATRGFPRELFVHLLVCVQNAVINQTVSFVMSLFPLLPPERFTWKSTLWTFTKIENFHTESNKNNRHSLFFVKFHVVTMLTSWLIHLPQCARSVLFCGHFLTCSSPPRLKRSPPSYGLLTQRKVVWYRRFGKMGLICSPETSV
jgi:hypothetical protein